MNIQPNIIGTALRSRICCWWADRICVFKRGFWSETTKAAKGRNTDKKSFKFNSIEVKAGVASPPPQGILPSIFAKLSNGNNNIKTRGLKWYIRSANRLDLDMDNMGMTVQNPKWYNGVAVNPLIMVTV